jgi:menaquinone-dependent protoporphyrinogen oxidase
MTALIVYASTHGHTGRIADRIADVLRDDGVDVDVRELTDDGPSIRPDEYEAVVVGASLHAGGHQKRMVHWLREHRQELDVRPNALFSVSLTAADHSEEARADAQTTVDHLIDETGWAPDNVALVAGALQYREYDMFTRVLMRIIARQHHISTDTSADVDLTDWDQVDRFAHHVGIQARLIGPPHPASAPARI